MDTAQLPTSPAGGDIPDAAYDDYDGFLKQAVRESYDRSWKTHRGNFLALVVASGQVVSMAADSVRDGTGLKKAALGAGSVVALRFGLRYFFAGPVGILLSAALIASAAGYLIKNQKDVTAKLPAMKAIIGDMRGRFDEIQVGYRAGRYPAADRNLMVEGLLKRFADQVDGA